MKKNSCRRQAKALASALVFLILGLAFAPAVQADDVCEEALTKCLVDAVVALIISGPQAAGAYALGCLNGYTWCLKYFIGL